MKLRFFVCNKIFTELTHLPLILIAEIILKSLKTKVKETYASIKQESNTKAEMTICIVDIEEKDKIMPTICQTKIAKNKTENIVLKTISFLR